MRKTTAALTVYIRDSAIVKKKIVMAGVFTSADPGAKLDASLA
jgi:hypothetical protein